MAEVLEMPNFPAMEIGKLRQYAAHLRLPIAKTAKKEEIIEAINRKLSGRAMPEFAQVGDKLKPGYARIRLLSDPMPGASNLPVYINANGYAATLPRDVDITVPLRVLRVLTDAKVTRKKQILTQDNYGREITRDAETVVPSYPFQVLEISEGEEPLTNLEIIKRKSAGPKKRYREMFGRWPRPRELTRAIEQKLVSLGDTDTLDASTDRLLGSSDTD